jgi:ribosomal protein S27AE
MSIHQINRFECTRCHAVEDVRVSEEFADDAGLYRVARLAPPPGWRQGCDIEPETHHEDLCPKCIAELTTYADR